MDRREAILSRLEVLLASVPGIITLARNRGELPEGMRPAVTLLDGDESAGTQVTSGRGSPGLVKQPVMVTMRPEIFVLLKQHPQPKNEGVGQDLNAFRILILKAVDDDAELASLVGPNGAIIYEGTLTDLATGRSMTGQMQLQFAFSYPFLASEFAAATST